MTAVAQDAPSRTLYGLVLGVVPVAAAALLYPLAVVVDHAGLSNAAGERLLYWAPALLTVVSTLCLLRGKVSPRRRLFVTVGAVALSYGIIGLALCAYWAVTGFPVS